MNFYFLPRYEGLCGEVTLANFPPNDSLLTAPQSKIVHVIWSDGRLWRCRDLDALSWGKTMVVTERMLPDEIDDDALAFLFLFSRRLPGNLGSATFSDYTDTAPAWRANIRLRSTTTSVSYQGEFPLAMAGIPQGSLVSIGPMIQDGGGITTSFLLFNMRNSPAVETVSIRIVRLSDRRVLREGEAVYNRMSVLPLGGLDLPEGELVGVMADAITGIPLYLSHDKAFRYMSLEHTHPPVELTIFGDRLTLQGAMKRSWLNIGMQSATPP